MHSGNPDIKTEFQKRDVGTQCTGQTWVIVETKRVGGADVNQYVA